MMRMKRCWGVVACWVWVVLSVISSCTKEEKRVFVEQDIHVDSVDSSSVEQDTASFVLEQGVLRYYPNSLIEESGVVSLDTSVWVIASGAFKDCSRLRELRTEVVQEIRAGAFEGCIHLERVSFGTLEPPRVMSNVFSDAVALKELVVPEASKEAYCVWGVQRGFLQLNGISLENVVVLNGELMAYAHALLGADGEVVLADSIKAIHECVFEGWHDLKKITGHGVKKVGARALARTPVLEEVDFPALEELDDNAMLGATALKSVTLPKLRKVGNFSFAGCTALTEVQLHEVKRIGNHAFEGCGNLLAITIGATKPVVGSESPFGKKVEGRDLRLPSNVKQEDYYKWAGLNGFSTVMGSEMQILIPPEGFTSEGSKITGMSDNEKAFAYEVVIPEGFTEIGDKVFADCGGRDFQKIRADGVVKIGKRAFADNHNLRKVYLKNLKEMGEEAFWNCKSSLDTIKPPLLEVIGDRAFFNCEYLTMVCAPKLKEIGDHAFENAKRMGTLGFGVLQVGVEPPELKGALGVKIDLLVVPNGCKDKYEKWEHRDKFGSVQEFDEFHDKKHLVEVNETCD